MHFSQLFFYIYLFTIELLNKELQWSSTLVGRHISPLRTLIAIYIYIYIYIYQLTQKPFSLDYAPNASTLNPIKAIRGLLLGAK